MEEHQAPLSRMRGGVFYFCQKIFLFILVVILILGMSAIAYPRGGGRHSGGSRGGHYSSHSSNRSYHSYTYRPHHSNYATGVRRDKYGKIARDPEAKREFMKETGFPHGRPGYVVDHVVPLKHGGADNPSNMQWQTKKAAKAKDRWE